MHTIRFWTSWSKSHQLFFRVLSLLLLLAIGFFWYSYLISPAPAITWEHYQELQTEEIPLRTFDVGLESIPVMADNHMVYETQTGSLLTPNALAGSAFLLSLAVAIIVLLTIITTLSRFWFLVGMGVFCLFIISLQTETLEILGFTNKLPAAGMLLSIVGLAYYFHSFRSDTGFFTRLFSFAILFLILGGCVLWLSEVEDPLLHLSVNGYAAGVVLALLFILMTGPEIPAVFINVLTQGTRQTKSLQHFLIISAFYLINLLVAYGIKTGYLTWNIWVIDFFFLFTLSGLLGIWGFRQREAQYASIIPADPLGVYLILSLAIVAFTTVAYLFATASDTVTSVVRDVILYSHLGYGIIFLFYIVANFGSMLSKNLQVYKVLYKPTSMPYFTFRFMGLITCFAFLVFDTSYKTVVNQVYAGYYNGYGDLYYAQGNDALAEGFYDKAVFYRNQNHHAHYALASIQTARLEPQKEKYELTEASNGNPTEFSFINLSETYQRSGNLLESVLVLNEAKTKFPNSGAIHNALGLAYSKLTLPDSALLSFQEARKARITKAIAETNLLATSARFELAYPADSLLQLIGSEKEGPQANALALANLQGQPIEIEFMLNNDTLLSATKATFLCNYFINQSTKVDTILLAKAITLARKPFNEAFKEMIVVAASQAWYAQGQVKRAFDLTREVAYATGRGKYFTLLGTWALEQANPQIAANYFMIAKDKYQSQALYYEALANTEADSTLIAQPLWDSLTRSADTVQVRKAKRVLAILKTTPAQALALPDEDKYLYSRYKIPLADSLFFWRINASIQSEDLRARAILDVSKKWFALDEVRTASETLSRIKGLRLSNKRTFDEVQILNLLLLAESDPTLLAKQSLENVLALKTSFPNQLLYLQALQDQHNNRPEDAGKKFAELSQANIHFEEGLIASARFFSSDSTDRLKPYSIIVSGLLARPHSIKLLKAYVKEAALLGFDDEADESLTKLRNLLSPRSFNRYIRENPDFFDIEE